PRSILKGPTALPAGPCHANHPAPDERSNRPIGGHHSRRPGHHIHPRGRRAAVKAAPAQPVRAPRKHHPRLAGLAYLGLRAGIALLGVLPWRKQSDFAGWLGRTIVTRSPRLMARVVTNLAHVMPATTEAERERIAIETGDCFGRTALELFASRRFEANHPWNAPTGPGLAAVRQAIAAGTGAIVVSGHYGGWEATRAWLKEQGRPTATIYRPLRDPRLDEFYRESVAYTGSPM